MSNTINIGGIEVSKFYLGGSSDVKIYLGTTKLYPHLQEPCFAVVADISQYSDRTYVDVYNQADDKWYKLNNLSQYEEYGVYGSGRTITYYDGKLTIDDGYEYMYSGGSWINVGEVSGSTIQTVWYDPPTSGDNARFEIGHYWGENYKMVFTTYLQGSFSSDLGSFWQYDNKSPIEYHFYSNGYYYDMHNPTSTSSPSVDSGDYNYRIMRNNSLRNYENGQVMDITLTYGSVKIELVDSGTVIENTGSTRTGFNWYNGLYLPSIQLNSNQPCHLNRIQVYNASNELVNDIKFIKNNGVTGSQEISMYDSVLDVTYNNTNSNTPTYHIVSESGGTEYPLYYDEKQAPPNNLTFSSMTEAEAYECPWVGMKATIDGDNYIFSGDSQSGYEWVEDTNHYLPDIPFSLNYNAKEYDSTNRKIPQTSGQLQNVDAVCNYGYKIVDHSSDGYISITGNSRFICSGNSGTYLNRTNTQTGCTMTIVSKAKTTSGYSILTNRQGNGTTHLNWMYRQYADGYMKLHGQTADLQIACSTTEPNILVARTYYDNGVKYYLNNWSSGTTSSTETFAYLNTATSGGALFCDYSDVNNEFWQGDFYWVYMSQNVLTDEQIQQVIDYNENL